MRLKLNQKGFSAFELAIAVAVVAILALAGYMVYNRQQASDTTKVSQAEQSPTASDVSSAPEINNGEDLDQASQILDQNDPGSNSDANMLDQQTSNF